MDLGTHRLFAAISERLNWLSDRQRVLAQNVAQGDTPGYQPRDLKPLEFRSLVARLGPRLEMASTESGQNLAPARQPARFREEQQKARFEVTLSGNAVSLDDELMKIAETGRDYQLVTNLYRKHLGLFRTAIGRSNG